MIAGVVVLLLFIATMHRLGKRMVADARADDPAVQQLMTTGGRARAIVTSVEPTGLTVNNQHVQRRVGLRLEPLDGSPPFETARKMFFLRPQAPNLGDVWLAWYDRSDPMRYALGVPDELDPADIPAFREFGIPHPLDDG